MHTVMILPNTLNLFYTMLLHKVIDFRNVHSVFRFLTVQVDCDFINSCMQFIPISASAFASKLQESLLVGRNSRKYQISTSLSETLPAILKAGDEKSTETFYQASARDSATENEW